MNNKSVDFHIKNNDYFGTLATVISLVRQSIHLKKYQESNIKTLNNLEKDLVYLQKKYKITHQ